MGDLKRIIGFFGLLVLFIVPNISFAIGLNSYSRNPAGFDIYVEDGLSIDVEVTGVNGKYISGWLDPTAGSAYAFDCVVASGDPATVALSGAGSDDLDPTGLYNEVQIVAWNDGSCTSYNSAVSAEYDGGADIFELLAGSGGGGGSATSATTSLSTTEATLLSFFAYLCMIIGFLMSLIVWSYFRR